MSRTALICAANDGHYSLLRDLILSIREAAPAGVLGRDVDLLVLDLGLTDAQRDALRPLIDGIAEPGWDIDFPDRPAMPGWFRAMTARPFLPRHFPGYDVYLWLDADTWVQDWSAVALLIEAADRYGLAIVPEIDRSYGALYGLGNAGNNAADCNVRAFGAEVGGKLSSLPLLNSGVLGIRADSPVWARWQAILAEALQRVGHKLIEQAALNLAIYQGGIGVHYLPAICNWLAVSGPPRIDAATGSVVEPYLPHARIGILHLTALTDTPLDTYTTDGRRVRVSLRYGDRAETLRLTKECANSNIQENSSKEPPP